MTRREQIIEALKELTTGDDSFFEEVADAILALPLDMPVNLSIYKKARTLSYHGFCEWFNNEIKKRNQ